MSPAMTDAASLQDLSFTISGRISRPCEEVYELVADPAHLSKYFTTGGARGRLEPGGEVTWDFHDFPGAFPVTVLEAASPSRIVLEWGGGHVVNPAGTTRITFTFEPLDGNTRTLVTIREEAWQATQEGAKAACGNCEGWTQMLVAMEAWAEHGVVLREGFYR